MMGAVDNKRYAAEDMMVEAQGEGVIGILSLFQGQMGDFLFFRVIIKINMLACQNPPLETAVLNLILAEKVELGE
jgi:hypothetical protein